RASGRAHTRSCCPVVLSCDGVARIVVRSLRSLWHVRFAHFGTGTTCPFVRSLRSLLLIRKKRAPYQSEPRICEGKLRERTKGRRPYKSERSERTTASKASVPHLRP